MGHPHTDSARSPDGPLRRAVLTLLHARRGAMAVMFAVLLVPLLLASGAAVDYARVYLAVRSVQGVADSAALAGVSVYTDGTSTQRAEAIATAGAYFARGLELSPGLSVATPQIDAALSDATCAAADVTASVTIRADVTVEPSLMGITMPALVLPVSATASTPLVQFSLDLSGTVHSALDALEVYWYKVPDDWSAPAIADLHKIVDNLGGSSETEFHACVSPKQVIGFALGRVPGGKYSYGPPYAYGMAGGVKYHYFSTRYPPTVDALPGFLDNCALQIAEIVEGVATPALVTERCFTPTEPKPFAPIAAMGAISCDALNGRVVQYAWNDMGGIVDIPDYDDIVISFTCTAEGDKDVVLER